MGYFSEQVISRASTLFGRAAAEQGGVISGDNPAAYNTSDPFRLWVIQVVIIVIFTRILAVGLGRIRQPRVIAEVIGGVILGPTIMGRIPNFSQSIFPTQSIPFLTLTADIGLVFFLFLVGLEIDTRVIKRNARASFLISTASLILPLGVGAGIAVPLYHQFVNPDVNIGYFILFVAVAVGITAFPVLCRILTEIKLLETTVGVVVLSAGVGNDVVGWILLALAVALVNASTGLTALWVLLASTGFVLFLLFPVRWTFTWLARKTGSLDNGQPTPFMMTITLLLVLVSAFFTDIIGVHPIFGGFLAGLVIPHEGGYAIAVVEKLEDIISIVLLPIYFALSGLNTNFSTLNNGITWGYVVVLCVLAFSSKFLGSSIVARLNGFTIRESGAIGTLMSCKGLVELIVLNIGFQAGILDTRTFSMFVFVAIVLTFITTPLTLLWYPQRVRVLSRHTSSAPAKTTSENLSAGADLSAGDIPRTNFTVVLQKVDHLPPIMTLTQLIQAPHSSSTKTLTNSMAQSSIGHSNSIVGEKEKRVEETHMRVNALRLVELTERTSAVLKSQEAETLAQSDSVISVFRTFGHLNRIPVSATLSVTPYDEFSSTVSNYANETGSQMVIVPWNSSHLGTNAALEEAGHSSASNIGSMNPFEGLFSKSDKASSILYSQFVRKVFAESPTDVMLYVDRGLSSVDTGYDHRIFFPFFGGPDDRLALSFIIQMCANPAIRATVVRIIKSDGPINESTEKVDQNANLPTIHSISAFPDTVYGHRNTHTQQVSDMADNLVWDRNSGPSINRTLPMSEALERIKFSEIKTTRPLRTILELAQAESKKTIETWESLLLVVGRGRRMATESHVVEMKQIMAEHGAVPTEIRKALGEVASSFVSARTPANLLVMQASLSPVSSFI